MGTEFMTIYWRDMIRFRRFKVLLFVTLIQPILWLSLFGLAMSSNFDNIIPDLPGVNSVSYLTFMAPGIIAMTILFTCLFSGMTILFDKEFGLMKELVASPMPRSHILIGLTLGGITKAFIQVLIIIGFGFIIGVRFFEGFSAIQVLMGFLGIFALVALFSTSLMFLSLAIGMKIEGHEALQGVITLLTLPLFFTSNALYPTDSFPIVLKQISYVNPMSHFITGARYFTIGGEFNAMGKDYVITTGDVAISFGFLIGFAIIMYLFAWLVYRKAVVT